MKRFTGLAALSCAITTIEGGIFKWSRDGQARGWAPAQNTYAVMPLLGTSPVPTDPPSLAEAKQIKRTATDNTCAYLSGDPGS